MEILAENDSLTTHCALRIKQLSDGKWGVLHLTTKKKYSLPTVGILVLVGFFNGNSINNIVQELLVSVNIPEEKTIGLIETFISLNFLVREDDKDHIQSKQILINWSKNGWKKASDYHLLALDYPFYDYSTGGRLLDNGLMREYADVEPDMNRHKEYQVNISLQVPNTKESLLKLNEPFTKIVEGKQGKSELNFENAGMLMSTVFGQLRLQKAAYSEKRAPYVKKTSPSGGGRHPTEGYLFALSIKGLVNGIYHFNSAKYTLDKIGDLPDNDELKEMFHGVFRADFNVQGIAVFTSLFERNMYRYREPRTFRTIFMDVGHLIGTMEMACKALGLQCFVHHGIHDSKIENMLRINMFEEGVIYGAAIGE